MNTKNTKISEISNTDSLGISFFKNVDNSEKLVIKRSIDNLRSTLTLNSEEITENIKVDFSLVEANEFFIYFIWDFLENNEEENHILNDIIKKINSVMGLIQSDKLKSKVKLPGIRIKEFFFTEEGSFSCIKFRYIKHEEKIKEKSYSFIFKIDFNSLREEEIHDEITEEGFVNICY